ncbi:MAG: hypothetical protein GXO08_04345 [Aquificae bacterium]|nr:hypothetical protein [Aquificota bacterium]
MRKVKTAAILAIVSIGLTVFDALGGLFDFAEKWWCKRYGPQYEKLAGVSLTAFAERVKATNPQCGNEVKACAERAAQDCSPPFGTAIFIPAFVFECCAKVKLAECLEEKGCKVNLEKPTD